MTMDIKHILFTSDLTGASRYVFQYAVSLANQYNARLSILYVMEEPPQNVKSMLAGMLSEKQMGELERQHKGEAMTTLVGKSMERRMLREGLELFWRDAVGMDQGEPQKDNVIVTSGMIVDEILKQSAELGCDLIVMGTHQRGFISGVMLGSSAKGVLNQTKTPVLLVPIPKALADE